MTFVEGTSLEVHKAESLAFGEIDHQSKRAFLAQDDVALMRILGITVIHTEEESSEELKLKKIWVTYNALEERCKKLKTDNEDPMKAKKDLTKETDTRATEKKFIGDMVHKLKFSMALIRRSLTMLRG